MSRSTDYTDELADLICERLALGESLRAICREDAMPDKATVFRWLDAREAFATKYARARGVATEAEVEAMLEIADDQTIPSDHKRHMLETRRWMASKLIPKKYGDRIQHANDPDSPLPAPQFIIQPVKPAGG